VADAYQGNLFSQQRVKSYVDLLTSDRLAESVVRAVPVGLSATRVQSEISATALPDTVLLQATVTDRQRPRALRLTTALATQFIRLVQGLETPPGQTLTTVRVEVVAGPKVGSHPVSPTPVRNAALATVLGLIAGVGGAALRESLDTTVKTAEVLHKMTSTAVLCTVPFDVRARKAPLILEGSARSHRAEALRQLRTNLGFVNVDQPPKTLVVTSAVPGEGKSTTACNLAIVFAETGKRVVLVDADLRRPRIADYLGLEGAVGLTNVLAGQARMDDALQHWGASGISVLPSGSNPPNPSELLGSRNMVDLLGALRNAFDVVIIDTPPLLPVTDAAVVASRVDGTVLVSRCAKTTANQAREAAHALTAVGARILGCVLNMSQGGDRDTYTYDAYPAQPQPRRGTAPRGGSPAPVTPVLPVIPKAPPNVPQPTGPGRAHHNVSAASTATPARGHNFRSTP
jgi:capsular exopolysaccharide synthesis family protein